MNVSKIILEYFFYEFFEEKNLFTLQEQNIPIDIHIGKLLDWLVSRRIISKNWHTQIPNIRNKIGNAMNDMPSHEDLIILLSGARMLNI